MYFFGNSLRYLSVLMFSAMLSVSSWSGAPLFSSMALAQGAVSAQEAAIAQELARGGKAVKDIRAYYEATGYKPIWLGKRRKAQSLAKLLNTADAHGLPRAAFSPKGVIKALTARGDLQNAAKAEVAASVLYVRYARALGSGYLRPRAVDAELYIFPQVRSVKTLLDAAHKSSSVAKLEGTIAPGTKTYKGLQKERLRLLKVVRAGGWGAQVPRGKSLRPGQSSPRVKAVRTRLGALEKRSYGSSDAYDQKLVEAVQRFQLRHGLNPDGVAGPATIAALNTKATTRLEQVLVAMERSRWMNRDLGKRHIRVNLADYTMQVVERGRTVLESRVVIGQAKEHRTPEFSKDMTHMVINPTWHVPGSIASKELLPKLKADSNYLNRRNMRLINAEGTVVDPSLIDLTSYSEGNFPFRIKQAPDRGNALGRVKFMFPNRFAIYLHDTPAKRLFGRDIRAFSHGCVRVQKPFELAYELLRPAYGGKSEATFKRILASEKERYVNLDAPVPVHLTYLSAWVDDKGVAQYRGDIYGRDRKIFRALSKAGLRSTGANG